MNFRFFPGVFPLSIIIFNWFFFYILPVIRISRSILLWPFCCCCCCFLYTIGILGFFSFFFSFPTTHLKKCFVAFFLVHCTFVLFFKPLLLLLLLDNVHLTHFLIIRLSWVFFEWKTMKTTFRFAAMKRQVERNRLDCVKNCVNDDRIFSDSMSTPWKMVNIYIYF